MAQNILVTYATRHGSTAEVAQEIGNILAQGNNDVKVSPVSEIDSAENYDAIVVGSPIHSGKWLPEAVEFVKENHHFLEGIPTACFLLSEKCSAIQRFQIKTKGLPEGDFRDWEAIWAWATELQSLLLET